VADAVKRALFETIRNAVHVVRTKGEPRSRSGAARHWCSSTRTTYAYSRDALVALLDAALADRKREPDCASRSKSPASRRKATAMQFVRSWAAELRLEERLARGTGRARRWNRRKILQCRMGIAPADKH